MKKEDELLKELTDMVKETKKGQIKWKLSCQTTEYNDEAWGHTALHVNLQYR